MAPNPIFSGFRPVIILVSRHSILGVRPDLHDLHVAAPHLHHPPVQPPLHLHPSDADSLLGHLPAKSGRNTGRLADGILRNFTIPQKQLTILKHEISISFFCFSNNSLTKLDSGRYTMILTLVLTSDGYKEDAIKEIQ